MSFALRAFVLINILWMIVFPSHALARPTKAEKAQRRSAFWGIFSDLYRTSSCLGFKPADEACAKKALDDALRHAEIIDNAVGPNHVGFRPRLISAMGHLAQKDFDKSRLEIASILKDLMTEFAEASAPVVQPTKDLGLKVYDQYCSSCHGDGRGSLGKLAAKLKSIPPAFSRPERFETQFPFGIYAVMIHGTDDGEMASLLDVLSVDELWAVAFYVTNIPYLENSKSIDTTSLQKINAHANTFALSTLAMSTDSELKKLLTTKGIDCGECQREVSYLRSDWPWIGATGRLSTEAKAPRDSSEARALIILLVSVIAVSAGFIFILKRSGKVGK